ncbi:MAG: hypothetical protein IPK42_10880 [Betaproteobacteria bacterium]|nr:hypothetical protein [Betaproteobacteria bacterium]
MLILEQPWTRQPQVAVGPDIGNPLTRGLVVLATPIQCRFRDGYRQTTLVDAGVYVELFGKSGVGKSFGVTGINGYAALGTGAELASSLNSGSITVLTVVKKLATGRGDLVTRWNTGGSGATTEQFNLLAGLTASKPEFYISNGTLAASSGASAITVPNDTPAVVVGSHSTSNCRVYVDGVLGASGIAGNYVMSSTSTQSLLVGNNVAFSGAHSGYQALTAIWNRQLTDAEVWVVSQNPWQLFAPQQIIIPTPAAAASTYTLSNPTYGVLTATTVTPRVTVTVA